MAQYYCSICKKLVVTPATSLDMTGKVLCYDHFYQAREMMRKSVDTWVNQVTAGSHCDSCDIDYPSCDHCIGA